MDTELIISGCSGLICCGGQVQGRFDVFLVDLSPFVAHGAEVWFCLHKVNVRCTWPAVDLLLVEYRESVTICLRIWASLHLGQRRLSRLWMVACFALRQNNTFDRLLTIADKRVGAGAILQRYLFVTQCCHGICCTFWSILYRALSG